MSAGTRQTIGLKDSSQIDGRNSCDPIEGRCNDRRNVQKVLPPVEKGLHGDLVGRVQDSRCCLADPGHLDRQA